MSDADGRLILFARSPRAGRVKTRLQPDLTPAECLSLHRALVRDALELLRRFAPSHGLRAEVSFSEPRQPGDWEDADLRGLDVTVQQGDDLGERLVRAFQSCFQRREHRVVVIGSDSPGLDEDYLGAAFGELPAHDVVIGPAEDGGYVLIGCSRLHVRPFQRIPWGTDRVLRDTVRRLKKDRVPFARLRPGHDLDTREDLLRTYRELEHLERVGVRAAPRTLGALREILLPRSDWLAG
ncbi:MAG: TIGR04282 family arsenosugar biosynthesis glycosyltransferase [Acidobacteriota bacterium]